MFEFDQSPDPPSRFAIDSDRFDRRQFRSALNQDPEFLELRERGVSVFFGFHELLCDVFCTFYKFRPRLRSRDAMDGQFRLHREIMKSIMKSREFHKLRSCTYFDAMRSAYAARRLISEIWKDLERFRHSRKSRDPRKGRSSFRKPFSGREKHPNRPQRALSEVANYFSEKNEDNLNADSIADPTTEMTNRIKVAVAQIVDELDAEDAMEILVSGWGIESGRRSRLDPQMRMAFSKRFSGAQLRRFAMLVGRLKKLAISIRESKHLDIPEEIVNVTVGADLEKLLRSELATLAHRFLRYDFFRRFADETLSQYQLAGKEKTGRGPIVTCIDCSGSMSGDREIMAKAIAIALLHIARSQQRSFLGILFGANEEKAVFPFPKSDAVDANRIIDLASTFFGGGTDFETPLRTAIMCIKKDEFNRADIVFISDGVCAISDAFQKEYDDVKQRKRFNTFSVFVTSSSTQQSPGVLERISDRVVLSSQLDTNVAGQIFETV